jgi:hypothetical protein
MYLVSCHTPPINPSLKALHSTWCTYTVQYILYEHTYNKTPVLQHCIYPINCKYAFGQIVNIRDIEVYQRRNIKIYTDRTRQFFFTHMNMFAFFSAIKKPSPVYCNLVKITKVITLHKYRRVLQWIIILRKIMHAHFTCFFYTCARRKNRAC